MYFFFIIKGFRTIVVIFIVMSTTFWPICPPASFRRLSNLGTFTELRTTSFTETTRWFPELLRRQSSGSCRFNPDCRRVTMQEHLTLEPSYGKRNQNRRPPLDSIKDVVRSSVKVPEFDKYLKKAGGYIDRNLVEITRKMKKIVRKPLLVKINKLRLRNLHN